MFIEYKSLSDEELDEKIGEVTKKINTAYAMGLDSAVDQLQDILENLRMELTERLEIMRYDIINERIPDSLVVGEDDEPDAPTE
jgi:hypothetical protein